MLFREIIPLKQSIDFKLVLPGSKSITNRALLCAALSNGKTKIYGALESDDTKVMMLALQQLGVQFFKHKDCFEVVGKGSQFNTNDLIFDLNNAGTATRFLTAIMSARSASTIITGDTRMQERPIEDLVDGLKQLGVNIKYLKNKGFPPIEILGSDFQSSESDRYSIYMKGNRSSQYFSALMMLGPLLNKPLTIIVEGDLVSKPYIDITISVMRSFGVQVINHQYQSFEIEPQQYRSVDRYVVEGDASAASYWSSIQFLGEGHLAFENLDLNNSIQGDSKYVEAMKQVQSADGGSINMENMPDVAMTLAVTAPFFKGQTIINGLSTLRIKETDRLSALENELKKLKVSASTTKDSIIIEGQGLSIAGQPAVIKTYNDHRMAMCFAVMGTKIPGLVIENPNCVDKTYPQFWNDLEKMYLSKPIQLGNKNLILTGMRGSGKSYYGQKIAQMLNRQWIDLDQQIEAHESSSIADLINVRGWDYFRSIEQKICSKYKEAKDLVISTGGGVVLRSENMINLKNNGLNVFIFADISILNKRLKKFSADRPSLTGQGIADELQQVWERRRDLYLRHADYVWDDTGEVVIESHLKDIFI